jgi:AcrR family transcriptional regulator
MILDDQDSEGRNRPPFRALAPRLAYGPLEEEKDRQVCLFNSSGLTIDPDRSVRLYLDGSEVRLVARRSSAAVREKLVEAAYELFGRQGIRAVGVDTIIERAGVAKMTFYRHFPSKEDLVLAFLDRRDQLWTREWLEKEIKQRATTPREQLLVIFDLFEEWFQRDDFEGCSFIRTMLETFGPKENKVLSAARWHLANIRHLVQGLAEEAGLREPDELARNVQLLMAGSIVAAGYGDTQAARRARRAAEVLIELAADSRA